MNEQDLAYLSIADLSRLISARDISPVDVVKATLERATRMQPVVGAYITILAESALESARQAEREICRGRYLGPLHGIPVSLKDLIYVDGVRTTAGSRIMTDFVPDHDASVVERLRAAGAVLVGKTQLYEFAMGPRTVYHYGPTRNPWDLERTTTGSSSGSAAAVSAGLCCASICTDTRGSIRGPASMCGVVGMKPTYGRVSRYGVMPLSWSMDHVGPITRTVRDCALVMNAIAGYDRRDPSSLREPAEDYTRYLGAGGKSVIIGVPSFFFDGLDAEYEAAVRRAIDLLESHGADVREVVFPMMEEAQVADSLIVLAEAASVHAQWIRTVPSLYGPDARTRTELGSFVLATDYLQAQRVRRLCQEAFAAAMDGIDVIALPTCAGHPPRFGEEPPVTAASVAGVAGSRLCRFFNFVGAPAISVPCGFSSAGMPIGLQIVGKPMDDGVVLSVAHRYEQLTEWHARRPPIH